MALESRSALASNRPRSRRRDGVSRSAFGRPRRGSVAAAVIVATGLPGNGTGPGPCDPAGAIVDCRQSPHRETTMEVVGSGAFWDATTAPANERSASSTSAVALANGSVLVTCRLGTDREGADGHVGVFASADGGESWEVRFLGLDERIWNGWPGEARG